MSTSFGFQRTGRNAEYSQQLLARLLLGFRGFSQNFLRSAFFLAGTKSSEKNFPKCSQNIFTDRVGVTARTYEDPWCHTILPIIPGRISGGTRQGQDTKFARQIHLTERPGARTYPVPYHILNIPVLWNQTHFSSSHGCLKLPTHLVILVTAAIKRRQKGSRSPSKSFQA